MDTEVKNATIKQDAEGSFFFFFFILEKNAL